MAYIWNFHLYLNTVIEFIKTICINIRVEIILTSRNYVINHLKAYLAKTIRIDYEVNTILLSNNDLSEVSANYMSKLLDN